MVNVIKQFFIVGFFEINVIFDGITCIKIHYNGMETFEPNLVTS